MIEFGNDSGSCFYTEIRYVLTAKKKVLIGRLPRFIISSNWQMVGQNLTQIIVWLSAKIAIQNVQPKASKKVFRNLKKLFSGKNRLVFGLSS